VKAINLKMAAIGAMIAKNTRRNNEKL
jgi:hypothetical protein